MSASFFHAGKRRPRPIWGPPGQFFAWAGKIQKLFKFCLFSLVGQWALFTRFGALAAIRQLAQGHSHKTQWTEVIQNSKNVASNIE